jgi:hypothetical protein
MRMMNQSLIIPQAQKRHVAQQLKNAKHRHLDTLRGTEAEGYICPHLITGKGGLLFTKRR